MTEDNRRRFFRSLAVEGWKTLFAFQEGLDEVRQKEEFDRFFESYESSYALTLAYPDDMLLQTARLAGIETEGRDKNEIVKELFEKKGGGWHRP